MAWAKLNVQQLKMHKKFMLVLMEAAPAAFFMRIYF